MKIVKLIAENVKRLHAVEIVPEETITTIGGKNGAGKSSVLDSIAYALGGEKLVPSEPIRVGESEARVVVDLGDLVVTRRFRRDKILVEGSANQAEAPVERWGETRSTLVVTNRDGARYPSPQSMLDKLLGKLTFDPLAFAEQSKTPDGRRQQAETLRKLIGLDLSALKERREVATLERATLKRQHDMKLAQLAQLPKHDDAPKLETPLSEISAEMLRAEELRAEAESADRRRSGWSIEVERAKGALAKQDALIADAEARLAQLRREREVMEHHLVNNELELTKASDAATAARTAVPDVAALRARLSEIETVNAKVRANQKYAELRDEVAALMTRVESQDDVIRLADDEKRRLLAEASYPVAGLGLSDTEVTLNGLPFDQAGTAEQVRVSVAIGIALNPTLKVLLVRDGNRLDSDSLRAVAAQAEAAGMQVWMEMVSENGEGVSVMLVDGEQVGVETA